MAPKQAQNVQLLLRSHIDFATERFLMFVLDEMAHEYERQYDDVIRLTLGKAELLVDQSITDAMVEGARNFTKSALVFPVGLPGLRETVSYTHLTLPTILRV